MGNEEPKWFKRNLLDQLNKVILRCYEEQMKEPVLIIDEAQLLDRDALEDIRLLTNYANPDKKLLSFCCGKDFSKKGARRGKHNAKNLHRIQENA